MDREERGRERLKKMVSRDRNRSVAVIRPGPSQASRTRTSRIGKRDVRGHVRASRTLAAKTWPAFLLSTVYYPNRLHTQHPIERTGLIGAGIDQAPFDADALACV